MKIYKGKNTEKEKKKKSFKVFSGRK